MTSFIAAGGSGRSASFIPAVPAAWLVTTIAFIVHLLCGRSSSSGLAGPGEEMRAALVMKQHQDLQFRRYHRAMAALPIDVDPAAWVPVRVSQRPSHPTPARPRTEPHLPPQLSP